MSYEERVQTLTVASFLSFKKQNRAYRPEDEAKYSLELPLKGILPSEPLILGEETGFEIACIAYYM